MLIIWGPALGDRRRSRRLPGPSPDASRERLQAEQGGSKRSVSGRPACLRPRSRFRPGPLVGMPSKRFDRITWNTQYSSSALEHYSIEQAQLFPVGRIPVTA